MEVIPAFSNLPPRDQSGAVSKEGLTHDCFHYNTNTQASIGTNIWNNLLESPGQRTSVYGEDLVVKCPSQGQKIRFTNING